jgi:integrase
MLPLLIDTGMRAGELSGLRVDDVDFEHQVAFVLGKGGRARACPLGALRLYLRFRSRHPFVRLPVLWIGKKASVTDQGCGRCSNGAA